MRSRPVIALLALAAVFGVPGDSRPGPDGSGAASVTAASPETGRVESCASSPTPGRPTPSDAVLFERVTRRARELADAPHAPPRVPLPDALADLNYDQYRAIRFRPETSLWRDSARFEVQLFHPGYRYRRPVCVHVVERDGASRVPFERERFRYEGDAGGTVRSAAAGLEYAGLRIHYPLDGGPGKNGAKDEVAVFLGASYFRLRGAGQVLGASARGVAVDPARPAGEEFPAFRTFWLVRPGPDDRRLTFYALLDGPSITGAYRFELAPGERTVLDVDARLFARRDVGKLGVAPFSSMFLHAGDRGPDVEDFRPRVHDSDGLLMHTSAGEWIWRPLSNGPGLRVTSLRDGGPPRGFGLAQRTRTFESYLDLEARYDRRPGLWASVGEGDWGSGGVELLEIPTSSEFNDNIAAYWVPDRPFAAGQARRFRYRLTTFDRRLESQRLGQVERTRIGRAGLPGQVDRPPSRQRRFVVDFTGGALRALGRSDPVKPVLSTTAGELVDPAVVPLPGDRGWRTTFLLVPDGERPADMSLFLEVDGRRVSETWSYVWDPGRGE